MKAAIELDAERESVRNAGRKRRRVVRRDDGVQAGQLRQGIGHRTAVEQDRQPDPCRPDAAHILRIPAGKRIHAFVHRKARDHHGIEPVRVTFANHVRPCRAGQTAYQAQVVAQRADIDLHPRSALRRRQRARWGLQFNGGRQSAHWDDWWQLGSFGARRGRRATASLSAGTRLSHSLIFLNI